VAPRKKSLVISMSAGEKNEDSPEQRGATEEGGKARAPAEGGEGRCLSSLKQNGTAICFSLKGKRQGGVETAVAKRGEKLRQKEGRRCRFFAFQESREAADARLGSGRGIRKWRVTLLIAGRG